MLFVLGMFSILSSRLINREFMISLYFSLFPSKMTAFGLKTAGAEAFNAGQPTGALISLPFPDGRFETLIDVI